MRIGSLGACNKSIKMDASASSSYRPFVDPLHELTINSGGVIWNFALSKQFFTGRKCVLTSHAVLF
jgi:hypothetical protein